MINIDLKYNGKIIKKNFLKNITPIEVIEKNNLFFIKKPIVALFNNKLIEINQFLKKDGVLEIITEEDSRSLKVLNHSTSHLMAHAIKRIYPQSLLVEEKITKDGFFYDIDFQENNFSEKNFPKIEKEMYRIVEEKLEIKKKEINLIEAYNLFNNNNYKKKILDNYKLNSTVSVYFQGDFFELCYGPHLINTNMIQHFKILKISGSYLEGNVKNKTLTRVYGISFFNYKDLVEYLNNLKERKERDHKNINKKHNFFMFSSEVGLGLPFWLKKGATIRRIIERYIVDKEIENDYQHVYTPILANTKLYKISGHLDLYKENMFPIMNIKNEEELVLRPMNCPHHMMIFKKTLHSYKDLPIKIAELGMMHRYEHSGAVSGLQRTREMTLNDAHIFLTEEQIKEEFTNIISLILEVYNDFNIKEYFFNLSTRDIINKNKYFNDDLMWDKAESILREILENLKINFKEKKGDAAFYGPKLDIQVLTALGNEETLSTVQLDFLLPKRFNLSYIGKDNKEHSLIVIHRAIISTMERFVSFLIEKNKGVFPLWIAPIQVIIIPIKNDYHLEYSSKIKRILLENNIRTEINKKDFTLNYKIKIAQESKIPFQIVIGNQEIINNTITFRSYGSNETIKNFSIQNFIKIVNKKILNKI
ncbi:threonine--tRNA ligase [Candidatus Phytoplasma sacchari]|uniref:Threonine--tRNA ligase n=1 Tax=Candidatus Phytoplasma sacchari TaxID=2609813 RepID=A0ABY7M2S1_9MOLU|nr:threonine--tRNA ligase [Candidatus Phytoplasma sacchari]